MYAKIFAQIYDGTLCTKGPWQALVTFQQMLVLADQEGNVDMTPAAISRRTTIPLEIIEEGIRVLLEPDPDSRTPTEEGRRILPLSEHRAWGWRIVNYGKYRQMQREQDRRDYHREYWHKRKADSTALNTAQDTQPSQPIAKAEAYAKAEKKEKAASASLLPPAPPPAFLGDKNLEALNGKSIVQLAAEWELPEAWGLDAEALGWKPAEVLQESERFRQYWVSGKGAGKRRNVKGWRQCWSNWLAIAANNRR